MKLTFAVPDTHGRFDLLQMALEKIKERADKGTIVFLGDYIDRGPDSYEIIDLLSKGSRNKHWKWVCLIGNHEFMMLDAIIRKRHQELWTMNGGSNTLYSYVTNGYKKVPEEHLKWVQNLNLYHEDEHRVYVHAGVTPRVPLIEQSSEILLWKREHRDYSYVFNDIDKHVVHGHTPNRDGPELLKGRTNLDTGAFATGRLVVGVFNDNKAGGPIETIECKV